MTLQNTPQTKIGYNSVQFGTTTRFIGHGECIERIVTENCVLYKTYYKPENEYANSDALKGVFPETTFWKGTWISENTYVIETTRVNEKCVVGDYLINCYSVGATDTIVFETWKKAPGRKKELYSSLTTFDSELYGKVGSKHLPKGINDVEVGEHRCKLIDDFRNRQYDESYHKIVSLYSNAVMGKATNGVIELSISKMDTSIEASGHFAKDEHIGNIGGDVLDGKPDVKQVYETAIVGGKDSDVIQYSQGFEKDLWQLIC